MNSFSNDDHYIDTYKIVELKNLLDDSFPMLVNTFLSDTDLQILKLEESILKLDYSEIRKIAHSIKGASANMGAKYLSALSGQIEENCKNNQYDTIKQTIQLIKNHQPSLSALMRQFL
jgi:HPt (histidine-containing phosphotransfer) domain-containing protein